VNATPHPPEAMLRTPGPESNLYVRMPTAFGLAVLAHRLNYCRLGLVVTKLFAFQE
jgi:hypothetical protein